MALGERKAIEGSGWKKRCFGNRPGQDLLAAYHGTEWGVPVYDDRLLFEMLTLEGAQAGLSWDTVLRKRKGYKRAFLEFDVAGVAAMTDAALEALRDNPEIIRNRRRSTARVQTRSACWPSSVNLAVFQVISGALLMAGRLSIILAILRKYLLPRRSVTKSPKI